LGHEKRLLTCRREYAGGLLGLIAEIGEGV